MDPYMYPYPDPDQDQDPDPDSDPYLYPYPDSDQDPDPDPDSKQSMDPDSKQKPDPDSKQSPDPDSKQNPDSDEVLKMKRKYLNAFWDILDHLRYLTERLGLFRYFAFNDDCVYIERLNPEMDSLLKYCRIIGVRFSMLPDCRTVMVDYIEEGNMSISGGLPREIEKENTSILKEYAKGLADIDLIEVFDKGEIVVFANQLMKLFRTTIFESLD